jgi:hypothetical protein
LGGSKDAAATTVATSRVTNKKNSKKTHDTSDDVLSNKRIELYRLKPGFVNEIS